MFKSLAVVGATGAVGRIMCRLLESSSVPFEEYRFLASARSVGRTIEFRGRNYPILELSPESLKGIDLVVSSTPDDVAKDFIPKAVQMGCVVVDESAAWRMDPKVPLVIPEVNPHAAFRHQGIIASPNCSTTQMVVALKPLHDFGRIRRVVVSTYQAASGAGVGGTHDLIEGTKAALEGSSYTYTTFAHPLAFNLIPHIGSPKQQGYTSEELKMVFETHKILEDDSIRICPTCVRVPVANCHSEAILVETEKKITAEKARELFAAFPGMVVVDDLNAKQYPMPKDCSDRDEVFVGRIREDLSSPNGIAFWCVSDNLRKGAATNAVQIVELLRRGEPSVTK